MRALALGLLFLFLAACASTAAAPKKPFAMRTYQMAILRVGPRYDPARADRKPLLAGHMANIRRLAAEGKLLVAGPFETPDPPPPGSPVGVFIFDVPTAAEAEALCRTDPTIADGYFAADVLPWYGPAGLTYDGQAEELVKLRAAAKSSPSP